MNTLTKCTCCEEPIQAIPTLVPYLWGADDLCDDCATGMINGDEVMRSLGLIGVDKFKR